MLNLNQAKAIVKRNFPDGKIQKVVGYKELYIFQIFSDDPLEGKMDPYYSVHMMTGLFSEFSVITDEGAKEILSLFQEADKEVNNG